MEDGVKRKLKNKVLMELDLSIEPTDEDISRIIDRCILEEDKSGVCARRHLPAKAGRQVRHTPKYPSRQDATGGLATATS